MPATDRLVTALHPRNSETRAIVQKAVQRLAAQLSADEFDQIIDAAEHPAGLTTRTLATRAQVTVRQLNHWTDNGWLTADQAQPGHGYPRTYPPPMVAKAVVMGRLVRMLGMDPTHASYAADELLAKGRARVPGLELTRRTR